MPNHLSERTILLIKSVKISGATTAISGLLSAVFLFPLNWIPGLLSIAIGLAGIAAYTLSKKSLLLPMWILSIVMFITYFIACILVDVPSQNMPRVLHLLFIPTAIGNYLYNYKAPFKWRIIYPTLCVIALVFFASSNWGIVYHSNLINILPSHTGRITYALSYNLLTLLACFIMFYYIHAQQVIRNALEIALLEALNKKQFELFYQPQSQHNVIVGTEALVRWHHPKRGLIYPSEFIASAENSRLIIPLGIWVLEDACKQLIKWQAHPHTAQLSIAINVSVIEFNQPDFVAHILAVLKHSGANPTLLKLEITEGLFIGNIEDLLQKMHQLRAYGIRISLDDFGTGFASLNHLKRLPIDQLKIDKSFIQDILQHKKDQIIIKSIIALAQDLNIEVIAEGVEDMAQTQYLSSVNCNTIQGYVLSPALPIDDFNQWLLRYNSAITSAHHH